MGNAFLLIVVGLLLFYLVISDKWKCVEGFAGCVKGAQGNTTNNVSLPSLPQAPTIPQTITSPLGFPNLALNTNWGINNGF